MKAKRPGVRILFWLACLSLPLCCVSVMTLIPLLFWGTLTIANQSGETLYVTPLFEAYGRSFTTVRFFSRFPYLPIFKEAGIELAPNASVRITCETDEDYSFSVIAVRNARGDYRQMPVQGQDRTLGQPPIVPEPHFSLRSFRELAPLSGAALEVARKAERPSLRTLGAIGLGLIPLGLFVLWILQASGTLGHGVSLIARWRSQRSRSE